MTRQQESALRERLKKCAITWVIDNDRGPFVAVKQFFEFQETSALGRIKTDVFLVADESLSGFSFDVVSEVGHGGYRLDDFTITKVRDYGTIDDLDLEGGFGYERNCLFDKDLGRVAEFCVKFKTKFGRQVKALLILARVEKMEFVSRFLLAASVRKSIRMSTLFMRHHWRGFNYQCFTGSWPTRIAASLGATRLISDEDSIIKRFQLYYLDEDHLPSLPEEDESVICARVVEKYPWFERVPQAGIIRKLCQLDDEMSLYELGCFGEQQQVREIRPDLRVGELARLAFETYFQSADRQAQEIARLQDGEYCNATFRLIPSLPVMKRVDEILQAPSGFRVGETGYLNRRYWKREYLIDGVKYRLTNNWHEPPHACDNRTPLEAWIRRMGLAL